MSDLAKYLESRLDIERMKKILERQILILAVQNADFRMALEEIDAVAVSKKAGAAKKMQAIARAALSNSSGVRNTK
jgi:hypothetical protein